jgi:hypothetical protein
MNKEDEVILERRLTTLELGIEQVKANSDERLAVLLARFDKIDRRAGWWVNGIFAVALGMGGIYLDAYLNKEETIVKPVAVVSAG